MGESSFMSTKNWDHENPKNSTVETPYAVAKFLAEEVMKYEFETFSRVVDVGCNKGSLSLPYQEAGKSCLGIDIDDYGLDYHSRFLQRDFLKTDRVVIEPRPRDIVVCNPPFNQGKHKIKGRKLIPELFLDHMIHLWGIEKLRAMLICPMGFRLNQRKKSARWRKYRNLGLEITSICSLPLDIFEGVQFHSEVLFIGDFDSLPSHMFLSTEALK